MYSYHCQPEESDGQERMKIIHTIPPYFHCSFKIFSQHQKGELFLGCGQTQFVNEAGELEAWDLVPLLLFELSRISISSP